MIQCKKCTYQFEGIKDSICPICGTDNILFDQEEQQGAEARQERLIRAFEHATYIANNPRVDGIIMVISMEPDEKGERGQSLKLYSQNMEDKQILVELFEAYQILLEKLREQRLKRNQKGESNESGSQGN